MEYSENATALVWLTTAATIIMVVLRDYNWLIAFLLFGVLAFVYRRETRDAPEIGVERIVKGKNFKEGDHVKVKLIIINQSAVEFRGEVVDLLPTYSAVWEGSNINLMVIPPYESREMIYKIAFERRGKYTIGPVMIRHHNPSLIQEKRFQIESLKEVVIIPQPERVTSYTLPTTLLTSIGGLFRSKLVGDGMDFSGVREYRIGDPMRRVNWKATAKHGKLFSNEFEINRSTNVIMVLDLTEESIEIADASVRAALGLAEYLLNSRTKVGLITLGEFIQYIPLQSGRRHMMEITQHLTTVTAIRKISELALFKQRLNQTIERVPEGNHEVILFSSLNRPENVRILTELLPRLGNLSILAPTAFYLPGKQDEKVELSAKILRMRKFTIRSNLADKGIAVYEWTPDLPFDVSVTSWRNKQ